jgi:acyl-CoA reductase-like NAD-dependent aldehyde dehydrogenase
MHSARTLGFFIDGQWFTDGREREITSPFDGTVVGKTFEGTAAHLDKAIRSAVRSFEITRRMASYERHRILTEISKGIASRREEFARVMALEAGKPLKTARIEVDRAIFTFHVAAEESLRIGGQWMSLDWQPAAAGRSAVLRSFPLGPIAAITPFNFPLNLVAHKVAPAIATGCTMVLKPAPKAPLCALMLAELVDQAGWPAGALNVLLLENMEAERMAADPRFKLLTFTGSGNVGWMLKSKTGKKRVVLELGGNAAVIVHSDANMEYAAERCALGGFSYAGQSCISVQRIYVHSPVKEKFTNMLLERVKSLRVGDPLDEATDVGPMISEAAAKRAESWIQEAQRGAATVLTGGQRSGAILAPTVLTGTSPDMRVNCEEVFAPVVVIEPYDDFSRAIAAVNASPYGLQAGVFTHDSRRIHDACETLQVGALIVNDSPTFRMDQMPYGGTKDSGMGREGLRYAMQEMMEPKLLVFNSVS